MKAGANTDVVSVMRLPNFFGAPSRVNIIGGLSRMILVINAMYKRRAICHLCNTNDIITTFEENIYLVISRGLKCSLFFTT